MFKLREGTANIEKANLPLQNLIVTNIKKKGVYDW